MDISYFLAKALGLYLIIISIVVMVRSEQLRLLVQRMANTPFMFLTGVIALIMGILLVVSHNIWTADWRVIITIIGWLALIKGIVRLLFPEFASKVDTRYVDNVSATYITFVITLIIGVYLCYIGFFTQY